ncbi:probable helicase senataxin isoform X2 [Euwallacea fornicatus]|uniref:probable helicase senataxin isoform X2 n=1 Tax=Euwallacea fornicatus TaxID=995702 RepID=UPI00338ECE37
MEIIIQVLTIMGTKWHLEQIETGTIIDIDMSENMVGRNANAKVCLPNNKVSRLHANFVVNFEGSLCIQDLKSVNGTFVNGTQIAVYLLHQINAGDIVSFGLDSLSTVECSKDKVCFFKVVQKLPTQTPLTDPISDIQDKINEGLPQPVIARGPQSSSVIDLSSDTSSTKSVEIIDISNICPKELEISEASFVTEPPRSPVAASVPSNCKQPQVSDAHGRPLKLRSLNRRPTIHCDNLKQVDLVVSKPSKERQESSNDFESLLFSLDKEVSNVSASPPKLPIIPSSKQNRTRGDAISVDNQGGFSKLRDNSVIIDITADDEDEDIDFSCSQIFHLSQMVKPEVPDEAYQRIKNELAEMDYFNEPVVVNLEELDNSGFENTQEIFECLEDRVKIIEEPPSSTDGLVKTLDTASFNAEFEVSANSQKKYCKLPMVEPNRITKTEHSPKKKSLKVCEKVGPIKRKSSMETPVEKKRSKSTKINPLSYTPKDILAELKRRHSASLDVGKTEKETIKEKRRKKLQELSSSGKLPDIGGAEIEKIPQELEVNREKGKRRISGQPTVKAVLGMELDARKSAQSIQRSTLNKTRTRSSSKSEATVQTAKKCVDKASPTEPESKYLTKSRRKGCRQDNLSHQNSSSKLEQTRKEQNLNAETESGEVIGRSKRTGGKISCNFKQSSDLTRVEPVNNINAYDKDTLGKGHKKIQLNRKSIGETRKSSAELKSSENLEISTLSRKKSDSLDRDSSTTSTKTRRSSTHLASSLSHSENGSSTDAERKKIILKEGTVGSSGSLKKLRGCSEKPIVTLEDDALENLLDGEHRISTPSKNISSTNISTIKGKSTLDKSAIEHSFFSSGRKQSVAMKTDPREKPLAGVASRSKSVEMRVPSQATLEIKNVDCQQNSSGNSACQGISYECTKIFSKPASERPPKVKSICTDALPNNKYHEGKSGGIGTQTAFAGNLDLGSEPIPSFQQNSYNLRRTKSSDAIELSGNQCKDQSKMQSSKQRGTAIHNSCASNVPSVHNLNVDPRVRRHHRRSGYPNSVIDRREEANRRLMWTNGGPSRKPASRLPLISVDDVTKKMVHWWPNWLLEQVNNDHSPPINSSPAKKIPLKFHDPNQYYDMFSKLVLLETWQYCFKGFRESVDNYFREPTKVKIEHARVVNGCLLLDCGYYISREQVKHGSYYKTDDFVMLEMVVTDRKNSYASLNFALVQKSRRILLKNDTMIYIKRDLCRGEPHAKVEFTMMTRYQPDKQINVKKVPIIKLVGNVRSYLMFIRAIKDIIQSPLCSMILCPQAADYKMAVSQNRVPDYGLTLNAQQKSIVLEAATLCTGANPGIYCFKGPPGTGKSTVIISIIFQILSSYYLEGKSTDPPLILLAAPSNTAVDNLISKLSIMKLAIPSALRYKIKLVRIGPETSISDDVRGYSLPKLAEKHLHVKNQDHPQFKAAKNKNENLVGFAKNFFGDRYMNELKQCENLIIEKSNIICTTLNSCINGRLTGAVNEGLIKFTCCIIDEATQCHEIESLLPSLIRINKFVLVGDPQQLNATIMNRDAVKLGFEQSLFTRLANNFGTDPRSPIKMLTDQYRMHPEICSFPNKKFYNGLLRTVAKPSNKLPEEIQPYLVFNCEKISQGDDYTNMDEVVLIKKLLSTIFDMVNSSVKYSVGIITPYNAQKDLIYNNIEDLINQNRTCKITANTVDSFQGSENDIIIISCVRDSSNSFLQNENRLNVALTRAKQALYIIGNYTLFKECRPLYDLREDAKKRKLLLDIKQNPHTIDNFKQYLIRKCNNKTGF